MTKDEIAAMLEFQLEAMTGALERIANALEAIEHRQAIGG